jgi:hypothetical protein
MAAAADRHREQRMTNNVQFQAETRFVELMTELF